MIEPLTSLAFSVYSGKGVYALLLGSGLSSAAQIPTGWGITLDLIRKVAAMNGEDCGPTPADWFLKKFGKGPDYSVLLEALALTPAERTNALAEYFEATVEERESGKKIPTSAHRAVAQLVAKGYFRVIVTTNFDRLLEQALQAGGINPIVISTADMVRGAVPLVHSSCTVVKIHGDYKDTRLRNTSQELSTYEPDLDALLDRIFDEYGLIVCGWSATWDPALRAAILRSPNRRYSLTWAQRGELTREAEGLILFRRGSVLEIDSADEFFASLAAKIDALERFTAPHPLSTALAVASLKKYIVEDRFQIELSDLLTEETERQVKTLSGLSVLARSNSCEEFLDRVEHYERSMEMLTALIATGCYWGKASQSAIWAKTINRMIDLSPPQTGLVTPQLVQLRRYPACILLYAGGVAALASGNFHALKVLLKDQRTTIDGPLEGKDALAIEKISAFVALNGEALIRCTDEKKTAASSEHVYGLLRDPLRSFLPNDLAYDDTFDRFEYLLALVICDARLQENHGAWGPIGRFGWRKRGYGEHVSGVLLSEYESKGTDWEPLRAGIFANKERFLTCERKFREETLSQYPYW